MASTLDTAKLAKVRALMEHGATEGERAAARRKAEVIAQAAGLELDAALSKLDDRAAAPKTMADAFNDLFNSPAMREHRARRERERLEKCQRLLKEFGSREAIFAETEHERLLSAATEHLKRWGQWNDNGRIIRYVSDLDGWDRYDGTRLPHSVKTAVMGAFPMPETLAGAFAEWTEWQALYDRRSAFVGDREEYQLALWVLAREEMLEWMLDSWSDPTFEGAQTRVKWLHHWECVREIQRKGTATALKMLMVDLVMLKMDAEPDRPAASWRTADKRAAVLAMLAAQPGLSDREIARRLAVSPQTVNTWRKKRAKEAS